MSRLAYEMLMMPGGAGADPEEERRKKGMTIQDAFQRNGIAPQMGTAPMTPGQAPAITQSQFGPLASGYSADPGFDPQAAVEQQRRLNLQAGLPTGGYADATPEQRAAFDRRPVPIPPSLVTGGDQGAVLGGLGYAPTQPTPASAQQYAQPPAGPLAAALQPGGNTRTITNGANTISVPMNADFTQFAGPQTLNGQPFAGTPGALESAIRGQHIAAGQGETGVPGVPGLAYYMDQLGRSGMGGSPALDQQKLQAAFELQNAAAHNAATVAAAHGRQATPQDKAQQFAEAAAAQALQSGMNPAAAANQALQAQEAFADYQRRAGLLGIPAPAHGQAPGAAGQAPLPPGAASPGLQASQSADSLLNAILPMSRDAKGLPTRGAFTAAGLGQIPANLLSDPAALSSFAQQAMSQLKPEEQVAVQNALAQEMAKSYLLTGPTLPMGHNIRRPDIDLENGLGRITTDRRLLGAMGNMATGGLGYNSVQLPQQFGSRQVPLDNAPGAFSRLTQSGGDQNEARRRYAASRALLGSLAQALSNPQR